MVDNQHQKIKGYGDLSQSEIDMMNRWKELGETISNHIRVTGEHPDIDKRWVAIATTHLQQGIMAAIRSIARPTTF